MALKLIERSLDLPPGTRYTSHQESSYHLSNTFSGSLRESIEAEKVIAGIMATLNSFKGLAMYGTIEIAMTPTKLTFEGELVSRDRLVSIQRDVMIREMNLDLVRFRQAYPNCIKNLQITFTQTCEITG